MINKYLLIKVIFNILYFLLAGLHIFLVNNVFIVLILVVIFELVRLVAINLNVKFIVFIMGVFSCVFIILNYYSLYNANKIEIINNQNIANNINSYSSKYWTNQEVFQNLIEKQENIISNVQELPNIFLVGSLVVIIEFSLAYLVIVTKNNQVVTSNLNCNKCNTESVTFKKSVTKGVTLIPKVKDISSLQVVTECNTEVVTPKKSVTKGVTAVVTNLINKNKLKNIQIQYQSDVNEKSQERVTDYFNLNKKDFMSKYDISYNYYRVLGTRLRKKNESYK